MRAPGLALILCLAAAPALADAVIATRTIRAMTVLGPQDMAVVAADIPGALTDPALAVGLEARVTLYAGRPIAEADLGRPALIERNQTVALIYRSGGLSILTEGRALDRAAVGEAVRVMNLSSRATVTGTVAPDGSVLVNAFQEG
jgi:flagellar basal body P-ring formation protein FlgA